MEIDEELFKQWTLWNDFETKLTYENRFFLKHEVLDTISCKLNQLEAKIPTDTTFYRARNYTETTYLELNRIYESWHLFDEKTKSKDAYEALKNELLKGSVEREIKLVKQNFWGYQKGKNLKPPKEFACDSSGRGNPPYINYLYLADSKRTALAEVRPIIDSIISIAKIINKSDMKIIDFSYDSEVIKNDKLIYLIAYQFARPYGGKTKEYLATQYLSEFVKHHGYDGLKYSSSLCNYGANYLFFNDTDFEDVNSRLYKVKALYIESECANADFEPGVNYRYIPSLKNPKEVEELKNREEKVREFFDNFEG